MQYSDLTTALGDLMVVTITNAASATPSNDTNFNNILPRIIDDAEQRIYRELDFLATQDQFNTYPAQQNNKYIKIPNAIRVVESASVLVNTANIIGISLILDSNGFIAFSIASGNILTITDPNLPASIKVGNYTIFPSFTTYDINSDNGYLQGAYKILSKPTPTSFTIQGPTSPGYDGFGSYLPEYTSDGNGVNAITVSLNSLFTPMVGEIWRVGAPTTFMGDGDAASVSLGAGGYTIESVQYGNGTFTINAPFAGPDDSETENNDFVTVQYVTALPAQKKQKMERLTKDAFDIFWPADYQIGQPQNYCVLNNNTVILGPTPDQNYSVEFTGVFRPAPISSTNTSTYLSINYPDLFMAACMVFGEMYQKDADLPANSPPGQDATKWESQYQLRKASALSEVQRQKGAGPNWSSYSPTPESNPPRP